MIRVSCSFLFLVIALAPLRLGAQGPGNRDPGRAFLSRVELEELAQRYGAYAESPAYSARLRARARADAEQIRVRLEQGDFEEGDHVLMIVEGEEALSDTFTVDRGRVLRLGEMGEVPLTGVLRSEFEPRLNEFLAHFLREPETRTESYLRIAVDGAVVNPGFLRVPANIQLADVITLAGGLAQGAELDNIHIERGERRIWSGYPLQQAQEGGLTVDQMRLRNGDRIVVPQRTSFTGQWARNIGYFLALPLSVAAILALF